MAVELLDLPNEILAKILYYLPPADLLAISKLNRRLETLSCAREVIWNVNFKESRLMSREELKEFFLSKRSKSILSLDFEDCYTCVTDKFWESCIIKCKSLKCLSFSCSRVSLVSLIRILSRLPHLEELSWSLVDVCLNFRENSALLVKYVDEGKLDLSKLRRLSVYFHESELSNYLLSLFLKYTVNLECLRLHPFATTNEFYFSINPVPRPVYQKLTKLHSFSVQEEYMCKDVRASLSNNTLTFLSGFMLEHSNVDWKKLYLTPDIVDNLVVSSEQIQDILSNLAKSNVYFPYKSEFNNFHIKSKEQLSSLSICNATMSFSDLENIFPENKTNIRHLTIKNLCFCILPEMHQRFKNFFLSSRNIVKLDFLHTHFGVNERALDYFSCLKALKSLSMQSCAILSQRAAPNENVENDDTLFTKKRRVVSIDSQSLLLPLVQNCVDICDLEINGCMDKRFHKKCCSMNGLHITDTDLAVIPHLMALQKLVLRNLPFIRHGYFLQEVSKNCKNIKRLILVELGSRGTCNYISSLCHFLKNTVSLVDLVICHGHFDLNSETFWSSLAEATKIERVCLRTDFKQTLVAGKIYASIVKLSNLSSFHIHASIFNHNQLQSVFNKISRNKNVHHISFQLLFTENSNFLKRVLMHGGNIRLLQELCYETTVN
ncbi:F-box/LRR-repeat protein 18-like [Centruroides vittatus]|uniref:F-box/LRR-repeat protein 18-like n=1 Tax=Centruroides vittatus TaxID=120091 RepID=UPI00350EBF06